NWTGSTASITFPSGQGTNSVTGTFDNSFTTGTLGVNAYNGCGTSAVRSLAIISTPGLPSAITGNTFGLCAAHGVPYSVTTVTGVSYSWTVPTGATIASG